MIIAVRYHSRGGNTRKLAEAIADAVGVVAESCDKPVSHPVDLLFLGGSVYGFGLDDATKEFISSLDPVTVKTAALFGTSAIVKTGNQEMSKLLQSKGITVLDREFYCRGEFTVMHRSRPNAEDLKKAADFAVAAAKG